MSQKIFKPRNKKYIVLRNKQRKNFLEEIGKKEKVFENLGVSDNCSAKKT